MLTPMNKHINQQTRRIAIALEVSTLYTSLQHGGAIKFNSAVEE